MNLQNIFEKIDSANNADPNREESGGSIHPKEWLYGRRMTEWLNRLEPNASIELRIAARGQHICRWEINRDQYPMDRIGYLKWRAALKKLHADKLEELLKSENSTDEMINRVRFLVQKRSLKQDSETQLLEDVICLVFLSHYFENFKDKHSEEKIISIISQTWKKMSSAGHDQALAIPFSPSSLDLIKRAVNE